MYYRQEYMEEYRRNHSKEYVVYMIVSRCKKKGMECDKDYLLSLECPKVCPILGTPISFQRGVGTRKSANTASYDRIDNAKGYIKGNVKIISRKANSMKCDLTLDQSRNLLQYMEGKL